MIGAFRLLLRRSHDQAVLAGEPVLSMKCWGFRAIGRCNDQAVSLYVLNKY
jgi:hypothetical protein